MNFGNFILQLLEKYIKKQEKQRTATHTFKKLYLINGIKHPNKIPKYQNKLVFLNISLYSYIKQPMKKTNI